MQTFLKLSDSVRLSYNEAFATINAVLARTTMSSLELTQKMVFNLIPLVKDLWSWKSTSLKEEMLITLVLTKDHVTALASDTAQATFRIDLENLVDALQTDYSKRLERDQLHMGDLVLDFSSAGHSKSILSTPMFAMQRGRMRAEPLWAMLYLTASYVAALDQKKVALQGPTTKHGEDAPSKRSRMTTLLYHDILRLAASAPTPATRTANLQYLCFLFQLQQFTSEAVEDFLDTLTTCMTDQNTNIARWAILALACLAAQSTAQRESFKDKWFPILQQVSRVITVEQCSRAAAYLFHVLLSFLVLTYGDIANTVVSIFESLELQGPTSVNDASLGLLGWLMEARAAENPSTATATAEQLIQWLFQKWIPSSFDDKEIAARLSSTSRPYDYVQFLGTLRGQSVSRTTSAPKLCGPIAQAWLKLNNAADVIDFLLLQDKSVDSESSEILQPSSFTNRSALSVNVHIIDGLDAETNRTLETWERIAADRPQSILPDMINTVLGLVVVNAIITSQPDDRITRRIESLRKKSEALVKAVMNVLARADFELERIDVAFNALADYIPLLSQQTVAENFPDDMATICVHVTNMLQRRQQGKQATSSAQEDIDMDDGFDSQVSEAAVTAQPEDTRRDIISLSTDKESFRRQITAQAHLVTELLKVSVEHGHIDNKTFSASVVTYLTELPPPDFFACRSIFLDILISCNVLQIEGLEDLLDHLSYFLSTYDYNRHEVALLLEVDLLHHTIANWTSQEHIAVHEMGTQAYEWFIGTALEHDVVSSSVKLGLVNLFFAMIKRHGPEYIAFLGAESTRTTLFKLLHSSDVIVLHRIVRQLPEIFHQYTLDTHENVFDDIHTNSLYNEEWLEGNALRMLLFSTLGSRWHTLVRRCLYHVFETAGTILQTAPYATRCIAQVAESVQLPDSRSLFRLFAGQLLYTWTRSTEGNWNNIPFNIFNYPSLESLLMDVREEVYAQLLMRNEPKELAATAAKLGYGQSELAASSFARSLAYSLTADAEQKSERPAENDRSETRLRAVVGSQYSSACRAHFPKALGIMLLRTNFELKQTKKDHIRTQQSGSNGSNGEETGKEVFERIVEKRISNEKAANHPTMFEDAALHAFKEMRSLSSSDMKLPDPQQPMFRPRGFFDVADRLARRSKINIAALFNPPVYVFVLRLLLSSLHDSLGSLHACLIVRKIRILVALSGRSVLSGYPLEITLHSLRPLLTDKQCAEDALGIVQYLYTNGIDYLKQELRFVAGMNITTIISLRKFAGSSQESTTQESQHRTTINRANAFRTWLVETWNKKFLENMENTSTLQAYMRLVSWAHTIKAKANALVETTESNLILQILDDRRLKRGLLASGTWNLALELLCHDFEEPTSYREDALGLDHRAKAYASEVWASCKSNTGNTHYLQWAAKVLGRASNSPDFDSTTLLSEQKTIEWDVADNEGNETSTRTIILTVANLLLSGDRAQTGLAEETLRSILLRTAGYPEIQAQIQEYLQTQSSSVVEGLVLMTEDVVVPLLPIEPVSLESCFDTQQVLSYDQWLRQLAITLIALNSDSPIVGSLSRVLFGVPICAETLFAPILHLVLERDVDSTTSTRQILSQAFQKWFAEPPAGSTAHIGAMLQAIIYLRRQPHPRETTHADRLRWLEIDFNIAAKAAHRSGMHTAALMFAELSTSIQSAKSSRRSTLSTVPTIDEDTMLDIFRNIEDPDSFYGVPQPPSLDLVLNRLDHESDGFKGLMFRGASLDSQMRMVRYTKQN
jgi:ataxia telangiectasia mutated family protein